MLPDLVCEQGMHHIVKSAVITSAVFLELWATLLVWALNHLMTCKRYQKYHCACRLPRLLLADVSHCVVIWHDDHLIGSLEGI